MKVSLNGLEILSKILAARCTKYFVKIKSTNSIASTYFLEFLIDFLTHLLQWCQLESLRVLFYEAKVPSLDGYSTI